MGANGYRFYGRKEQLRLQQILFHRELGVPLSAIAELLDLEAENQIAVLTQHREKLETERERYRALIDTIDHTILDLKGEGTMQNADLYKGFSPEKQAGYEAWLIERYGEPMREDIEHSRKSFAKMSPSEREAVGKELQVLEEALAGCTAQWRRCGSRWRRCPHQASTAHGLRPCGVGPALPKRIRVWQICIGHILTSSHDMSASRLDLPNTW